MTEKQDKQKRDVFADIAAGGAAKRDHELAEHLPPVLSGKILPINPEPSGSFKPMVKIEIAAQLNRELDKYRKKYHRYLKNLAPELPSTRISKKIKQFDWRIETDFDRKDFSGVLKGDGSWEQVDIPHYGAPLGKAVTYYRTEFNLTSEMMGKKALFVHFKAVDYKAHVFMNGSYLGSHEGFFAPFEFDFTVHAKSGENCLVVKVENDAICMGNDSWGDDGDKFEGDKIYAATGLGYDDPDIGWHHCPPGMGIYQDVSIEAREKLFIHDIFIRPLAGLKKAEAWIEIWDGDPVRHDIYVSFSIYGQNFQHTIVEDFPCQIPGPAGPGINYIRTEFEIPDARIWDLSSPWLYQIQVKLYNDQEKELFDTAKRQFGMRTFVLDENSTPKGRMFFNNSEIRLRGANTMGHLQQCAAKEDWRQLIDDILLAKICNMNFLRITQRPVQPEIYEYCDRLGLMTQTDLPLFGFLRRNQFCEVVRQTEEMEKLVRSHPCNIMVSLINEPFDRESKYHRHLSRPELEYFFKAANEAVRIQNPDRVIKNVDGDYCPPTEGLPDNHCYCGWYNGHGLDIGKLHKGYWQKTKPGWMHGCGEFGAEGLDFADVMRKYYPKKWLPENAGQEKSWSPDIIPQAQTGKFHYMWFDTQESLEDWADASQQHQRWATRMMTEAFRRDSRMNTIAIHLFIDAFPSGWMKTIMDVGRKPKPAYFTYRDILTPLIVSLRTDRYKFFCGEDVKVETWICNDLVEADNDCYLQYQLEMKKNIVFSGRQKASIPVCNSKFQGFVKFSAPKVGRRCLATVRLGLFDKEGKSLHDTAVTIELFPVPRPVTDGKVIIVGSKQGKAAELALNLDLKPLFNVKTDSCQLILIDDYALYTRRQQEINEAVKNGAAVIFVELPEGKYKIAGSNIEVKTCGMSPCHFVSRNTGHPLVKGFSPDDFKFWYDSRAGFVTPLLETNFTASGFEEILTSGNGIWIGKWGKTLAAAEKKYGKGVFRICQISLAGRITTNPTAKIFARRLLGLD